jgi:hypothetical protein
LPETALEYLKATRINTTRKISAEKSLAFPLQKTLTPQRRDFSPEIPGGTPGFLSEPHQWTPVEKSIPL